MRHSNFGNVPQGGNRLSNVRLIKSCAEQVRLSWKEGCTILRPLPGLNPEVAEPTLDAFRVDTDATSFGTWIESVPMVKGVGVGSDFKTKLTFITVDSLDYGDNMYDTPYSTARWALSKLTKDGQSEKARSWAYLFMRGSEALPPVTTGYFVYVLPYRVGLQDVPVVANAPLQVAVLPSSAGSKLRDTLMDDWSMAKVEGRAPLDLVDPNSGAFLCLWQKGTVSPITGEIRQSEGEFKGYELEVATSYPCRDSQRFGAPAKLAPELVRRHLANVKPWDQVLDLRSYEEQAEMLQQVLPADALMYAWYDKHPEWVTPGLKRKAASGTFVQTSYTPAVANVEVPVVRQPVASAPSQFSAPPYRGTEGAPTTYQAPVVDYAARPAVAPNVAPAPVKDVTDSFDVPKSGGYAYIPKGPGTLEYGSPDEEPVF